MIVEIAIDGGLQVDDGVKASAPDAFSRQGGEEGFDCVKPRSGCRREVEPPAGMAHQPLLDLGMLVGGVVIDHSFDQFSGRHLTLDDLLSDDMMRSVLRGAGYEPDEFREMMTEMVRRGETRCSCD